MIETKIKQEASRGEKMAGVLLAIAIGVLMTAAVLHGLLS